MVCHVTCLWCVLQIPLPLLRLQLRRVSSPGNCRNVHHHARQPVVQVHPLHDALANSSRSLSARCHLIVKCRCSRTASGSRATTRATSSPTWSSWPGAPRCTLACSLKYCNTLLMYYTLFIDHSFTATMRQGVNAGFKFNAQSLSGRLLDAQGAKVDPCQFYFKPCDSADASAPVRVGAMGKPDIVPLGALLAAAGIKSLDDASDALDPSGNGGDVGEPHRWLAAFCGFEQLFKFHCSESAGWSSSSPFCMTTRGAPQRRLALQTMPAAAVARFSTPYPRDAYLKLSLKSRRPYPTLSPSRSAALRCKGLL